MPTLEITCRRNRGYTPRKSQSVVARLGVVLFAASLAAPGGSAAAPTELLFSEYIEGSSNNKALEISNGTGAGVGLGAYTVELYANGSVSPTASISLSGTVAAGNVFVLANPSATAAILAQADQTSTLLTFNGDDALVLRHAGVIIDSIGQVGIDPGTEWGSDVTSTADNTLRRQEAIEAGDGNHRCLRSGDGVGRLRRRHV